MIKDIVVNILSNNKGSKGNRNSNNFFLKNYELLIKIKQEKLMTNFSCKKSLSISYISDFDILQRSVGTMEIRSLVPNVNLRSRGKTPWINPPFVLRDVQSSEW